MAQHLKAILALILASGLCHAEDLPDPTRPAVGLEKDAKNEGKPREELRLQSVLISKERKSAIINGQTVPLGGRLGDFRLAKIGEGEVVLQSGDSMKKLKLFPGIEKRAEGKTQPKH